MPNPGISTPNITTLSPTLDEFVGNVNLGGVTASARARVADIAAQLAAFIDTGGVLQPTWAALAATPGTRSGAPGQVIGDSGTHTDPVTGATGTPNSGLFTWSVSPAGWRFVSANSLDSLSATVATEITNLQNAVTSEITNRSNADTAEATNRSNADTAETTNRANADTALNTRLTTAEGSITTLTTETNTLIAASTSGPTIGFMDGQPVRAALMDTAGLIIEASGPSGDFSPDPANGLVFTGGVRSLPSAGFYEGSPIVSAEVGRGRQMSSVTTARGVFKADGQVLMRSAGLSGSSPTYAGSNGISLSADVSTCFVLLYLGQSNAEGYTFGETTTVAATALYPSNALMPSPVGPRVYTEPVTGLAPLVEIHDTSHIADVWETAASGCANHVISLVNASLGRMPTIVSMVTGLGSTPLAGLKQGSATYDRFLRGMRGLTRQIRSRGMRPVVLMADWMQGETDVSMGTDPDLYAAGLRQLQRTLDCDIRMITGQADHVMLFVDMMGAASSVDISFTEAYVDAVQRGCAGNPFIRRAQGDYPFPRCTGQEIHMSNIGQNRRGIGIARAVYEEFFGTGYRPLEPVRSWWASSTSFVVEFSRLIVMDTSGADITVSGLPSGNYLGFRFIDGTGSPPTITGHSIGSGALPNRQITFTLSAASSGLRPQLLYALERNSTSETRDGPVYGARGCLKAMSAGITSLYDSHVNELWALPFVHQIGR